MKIADKSGVGVEPTKETDVAGVVLKAVREVVVVVVVVDVVIKVMKANAGKNEDEAEAENEVDEVAAMIVLDQVVGNQSGEGRKPAKHLHH